MGCCLSFLHADDQRIDTWEMTDFIWDFGIIQSCDKGMDQTPLKYFQFDPPIFDIQKYENIQSGDIVWVQCRFLRLFYEGVLPNVTKPFVLVISDGDESFPSNSGLNQDEIENLLGNACIIHVFAQNFDYTGPSNKVSHLPIGMDFHTVAYKGVEGGWGEKGTPSEQESYLKNLISASLPTSSRKLGAFVDFQLSDTMHASFNRYLEFGEDRTSIFNRLLSTGLIDYAGFIPRSELWKKKTEYAFSISPHGNGLDCHRTWEDLILGCIVIVKTSPLDPLYEGLPVVIINDWSEITSENLEKWLIRFQDASTLPAYRERLTNAYWLKKIQGTAEGYK